MELWDVETRKCMIDSDMYYRNIAWSKGDYRAYTGYLDVADIASLSRQIMWGSIYA